MWCSIDWPRPTPPALSTALSSNPWYYRAPGTPNPPELLNSQHMRDLLVQLSDSYDLVIIDSPAVDSVSDARILAHMVDATIFVVLWAATPRQKVIGSLKQLSSAGAKIAGLVIHRAKATKENQYAMRT